MSEQVGIPNVLQQYISSRDIHGWKNLASPSPISRYLIGEPVVSNVGIFTLVPNVIFLLPVVTSISINLYNYCIRVTTSQAGSAIKCAIYSNARETLYPMTILRELNILSCAAVGIQTSPVINYIFKRNVLYWFGIWGTGTPQLLASAISVQINMTGFEAVPAGSEYGTYGYKYAHPYGAWPASFPAWGTAGVSKLRIALDDFPAVFCRFTHP